MEHIVFLDSNILQKRLRTPSFEHCWQEYASTQPDEVVARLQGATIAITNRVVLSHSVLAQLPSLRFIAVVGTGVDCVDLRACQQRNILVSNVRDWCTTSVAEHIFALILALRRHLIALHEDVQAGAWQRSLSPYLPPPSIPYGLAGSTMGIIGYGTLGKAVEQLARAFHMNVLIAEHKGKSVARPGRTLWQEMLQQSDIVTVLCPLTEETHGLLGEEEFQMMRTDSLLINCARGGIVDEQALAHALQSGRIAGAGVDALSSEPPDQKLALLALHLPQLIVTPHLAWLNRVSLQNLADQLVENLEAFAGGQPCNLVYADAS